MGGTDWRRDPPAVGRGERSAPRLTSRLVLLVASVALPLILLNAAILTRAQMDARARAEEQLRAQAIVTARAIDAEFAAAVAILQTLGHSAALAAGQAAAFRTEMDAAAAILPGAAIVLSDRGGAILLNTVDPLGAAAHADAGIPSARLVAVRTGGVAYGPLFRGPSTGQWKVSVAIPLPPALGGPAAGGALGMSVPAVIFEALLADSLQGSDRRAILLDPAWRIVAGTRRTREYTGRAGQPDVAAALATGAPGVLHTRRLDGTPAVFAPAIAPASGFAVAVSEPEATFAAPTRRRLLEVAGAGILVTVLGAGLATLVGLRIVRAIRSLALPAGGTPRDTEFREVNEIAARLRTAERWRDVLMAEMAHRVKNTLMTVQSIVSQTMKGAATDPVRFERELRSRLGSLGRAHDLLTHAGWEAAPIAGVIAAALAPWSAAAAPPFRVTIERDFAVGPRQAQALVLGLHELATNAVKYGALSVPGGTVALRCALDADGRATIAWGESGGPPLAGPPAREGFGTRLLQRVLPNDLGPGAEVARCYAPAGLRAEIRFTPATTGNL